MAGGKIIKDNIRPMMNVNDALGHLIFSFRTQYNQQPDVIVLSRKLYFDYRNDVHSRFANYHEEKLTFQGIDVIDSLSLSETEIHIY